MALQVVATNSVGTGDRVTLGTDDDVYVAAGVVIASTDSGLCIGGTGTGQVLHIEGQLASNNGYALQMGVDSTASGSDIYLGADSIVRSFHASAVALYGGGHSIELNGRLFAAAYGVDFINSTGAENEVINAGLIHALDTGVLVDNSAYVTIENSGTIIGDLAGIWVQGSVDGVLVVNSGTIKGGDDGIVNISDSEIVIENSGLIRLGAKLGTEDDTYDGSLGRITGDIKAGTGNDDVIGGAGTERIMGQAGADTLTGGGGRDQFIYEAAGDSTTTADGRDLITDFSQKDGDFLDLSSLGVDELDFVDKKHFTEADQVRYITKGSTTTVLINLDTVADAEMSIRLTGKIHLTDGDFAL